MRIFAHAKASTKGYFRFTVDNKTIAHSQPLNRILNVSDTNEQKTGTHVALHLPITHPESLSFFPCSLG